MYKDKYNIPLYIYIHTRTIYIHTTHTYTNMQKSAMFQFLVHHFSRNHSFYTSHRGSLQAAPLVLGRRSCGGEHLGCLPMRGRTAINSALRMTCRRTRIIETARNSGRTESTLFGTRYKIQFYASSDFGQGTVGFGVWPSAPKQIQLVDSVVLRVGWVSGRGLGKNVHIILGSCRKVNTAG